MRRVALGVGVLLAIANHALAADLPLKAPVAVAPAPAGWNGFYVGGEFGSVTASNEWNTSCVQAGPLFGGAAGNATCGSALNNYFFPGAPDSTANQTLKNSSFRPGIYAGAMFQFWTSFVAGIEGDYAFYSKTNNIGGIPGCSTVGCISPYAFSTNLSGGAASVTNKDDGSLRVRAGYLVTPDILVYAAGGFAFTKVNTSASCNGTVSPSLCSFGTTLNGNSNSTLGGYTVGGGLEWKIFQNWLLRGEYRYNNYGTMNANYFSGQLGGLEVQTNVKVTSQMATAGLAYMFPIPH